MKNKIEAIESFLNECTDLEDEKFKLIGELVHKYYSRSTYLIKQRSEALKIKRQQRRSQLEYLLDFEDCEYAYEDMDEVFTEGTPGRCRLRNKEEMEELMELIRTYTHAYTLDWQGPGEYIIAPQHKWDHDGDLIHTGKIEKVKE